MPAKKKTSSQKKPAAKRTPPASSTKKRTTAKSSRGGRAGQNNHLTAEAIRQKNQVRAVVLFACAILLGCLVLIPGDNLWRLGPRRHLGAVRQLGAAVARADDLRGRHHRHGEAQGLHQRQGVDDRGGHCAVLRHRLYLWQAGYSRWPEFLGVHSTPLHGKRRDWRRCAGRPAGPAHGAGRRGWWAPGLSWCCCSLWR